MAKPSGDQSATVGQSGYWELLRGNVDFRRLWIGNVVSLLGDWFNTIALYTMVLRLTGSELALGAVLVIKMLPWALASPIAGLLVDRFNRRRLMILSDVLRAVVVIGFLLIDEASDIYAVYGLIAAQTVLASVFIPAQSASIPNITSSRELVTANAVMSASWSAMLALGAAIGGLATQWLGEHAVFAIDSATYVLSAYFIFRTAIPQATDVAHGPVVRTALRQIADGWRFLRDMPGVRRIALAKMTWAAGGGALVYSLALAGDEVAPGALAAGIGILFAARGLGTGLGPIAARWAFRDKRAWPLILGLAIATSGVCYAMLAVVPWSVLVVAGLVLVAHSGSSANWVMSTVLLQERTADRFRGRVFATEWLLVTLAETLSVVAASVLLEMGVVDLRGGFLAFALLQIACGVLWIALAVPRERWATAAAGGPRDATQRGLR